MAETTHAVSFLGRFTVLRGAVRELWITFAVKVIGILAYSVMNSTLVLWLSYDLGFNDTNAGYIVFGWSAALTLFTVMVEPLSKVTPRRLKPGLHTPCQARACCRKVRSFVSL